jgi:hypothetical protein
MTVQTLAAELGIDIGDVGVVMRWLTADSSDPDRRTDPGSAAAVRL